MRTFNLEKEQFSSKGITLIALVITIIILLILASITIAILTGENGIITKAEHAKDATKMAQYKELVDIIIMEQQIEKKQKPEEPRPLIQMVAEAIDEKDWSAEDEVIMYDDYGDSSVNPEKCTTIIIQTTDGYEIKVNIDNGEITGEVEYVIKGKSKRVKIEFDPNEGTGKVPEPKEILKNFKTLLPTGENLSKSGCKLVGWSENKDGTGTIYAVGSEYKPTQDKTTTLYAVWEKYTITINFDNNKGEGTMNSISVASGSSTKLTSNTFTNAGYAFNGWNTRSDGKGTRYENNATITLTENTTLYAMWEEVVTGVLNIPNNEFLQGTKITFGGTAISGIQKIELKVGNSTLYTSNVNTNQTSYSESKVVDTIPGIVNADFYNTNVEVVVTSMNNKVGSKIVNIKNYMIGNKGALKKFATVVNGGETLAGKIVQVIANINLTEEQWTPIGESSSKKFMGTLKGNGNTISNLYLFAKVQGGGLFGFVENANIDNLKVEGAVSSSFGYIGMLVGDARNSNITNCSTSGTVTGDGLKEGTGGIVRLCTKYHI